MRTIRLRLPVIEAHETEELLDLVARVPGVVAALLDTPRAILSVVVASDAGALHVREQLGRALGAPASA